MDEEDALLRVMMFCSFNNHKITQIFTNLSLEKKALPKKQVFDKTFFLKSFSVNLVKSRGFFHPNYINT